jgi:uroporphyrinogen decarboxylase
MVEMPRIAMKSRERVMAALDHQEPDRIPRDFGGTSTTSMHIRAHSNLKQFLGIEGGPEEFTSLYGQTVAVDPRLVQQFSSDCVGLRTKPPSTWKLQFSTDAKGYQNYTDEWGVVRACPPGGYYYDVVSNPLAGAELADLERYPWPDPIDPGRFDGLVERAKKLFQDTDQCIILYIGTSFFNHVAALMGWEDFLISLAANPTLIKAVIEGLVDFNQRLITATLDRVGKYVHVFNLFGDMTHQHSLFVSKSISNEILIPAYQRLITTVKNKADVKILFHICGASRLLFEELIAAGVDAVNPVQVAADGMGDTAELKRVFGDRLTFWGGGCDTQHVLPHGTAEEVRREVRHRIADLAPGGGFVFCPVHNIQAGVPPENIVAMYDEVSRWDDYPIRLDDLKAR